MKYLSSPHRSLFYSHTCLHTWWSLQSAFVFCCALLLGLLRKWMTGSEITRNIWRLILSKWNRLANFHLDGNLSSLVSFHLETNSFWQSRHDLSDVLSQGERAELIDMNSIMEQVVGLWSIWRQFQSFPKS